MLNPQFVYYAAIIGMAVAEGVLRGFGRMTWVLFAVFVASLAAYDLGARMPLAQGCFHTLGFVIGLFVSRNLPGQLAAAIFLPLASIDAARLLGLISEASWWWAVYYLAMAQLLTLAVGADLHPLGRWVRAWAARITNRLEFQRLAFWRFRWT